MPPFNSMLPVRGVVDINCNKYSKGVCRGAQSLQMLLDIKGHG